MNKKLLHFPTLHCKAFNDQSYFSDYYLSLKPDGRSIMNAYNYYPEYYIIKHQK